MKTTDEEFIELYKMFLKTDEERTCAFLGSDPKWPGKRMAKYSNGALLGKYRERNPQLLKILEDDYTDEDLLPLVKENIQENYIIKDLPQNVIEKIEAQIVESNLRQLELLNQGGLDKWLRDNYFACLEYLPDGVDSSHIRGYFYVDYGYKKYRERVESVYNSDINKLKKLYAGVYGKDSQLYKYGLIEIDDSCELMAIDPPRVYDAKINKTINLKHVPKELVEVFLREKSLIGKLSLRGSNTYICDGKNTLQHLMEEVEIGEIFSITNFNRIPVTKLYSTNYNDSLWVKVDASNITFEELCKDEEKYDDSIITQVLHLEYKKTDSNTLITHLDHELVFYTEEEYKQRQGQHDVKGTSKRRLKSFKIDNAKIPLDLPCPRQINERDTLLDEIIRKKEEVPFLIFVLKSYFKHKDLIDEYFQSLLKLESEA